MSDKLYYFTYLDVIGGNGILYFTDAKVDVKVDEAFKGLHTDVSKGKDLLKISCNVYLGAKGYSFDEVIDFPVTITSFLADFPYDDWTSAIGAYDLEGNNVCKNSKFNKYDKNNEFTPPFAPGAKIVQINNIPVTDNIVADANGHYLSTIWLPCCASRIYSVSSEGIIRCTLTTSTGNYYGEEKDGYGNVISKAYVPGYKVVLEDSEDSSEIKSYYAIAGDNYKLLSNDGQYRYTFKVGETEVTESDEITADMATGSIITVSVIKGDINSCNVTVDGTLKTALYGATIESLGISGPCLDITNKKLVDKTDTITGDVELKTIGIGTVTDAGKTWFILDSKADVKEFATIVSVYGITQINGRLMEDIVFTDEDDDFVMIGSFNDDNDIIIDNSFRGTFEGGKHTVTLALTKNQKHVGFFGSVGNGAVIKDVYIKGKVEVTACRNVAGLIGVIPCYNGVGIEISGCTNEAEIIGNMDVGGIVGAIEYVGNDMSVDVYIKNCANYGSIKMTNPDSYFNNRFGALIGYAGAGRLFVSNSINTSTSCNLGSGLYSCEITNYYSVSDEEYEAAVQKSAEAFAGGEVTYLLNQAAGKTIWYQTCGEGLPSLVGDAETQTVYSGYTSCDQTAPVYSNTPIAAREQGHKDKADSYTYVDGGIVANCQYCDEKITAKVVIKTEKEGSLTGVTVDKSGDWTSCGYPDIVIKYASEAEGDYSETAPTTKGIWYLKAVVGGQEVAISDTYEIKEADPIVVPGGGSGDSGDSGNSGNSGTSGGSGVSGGSGASAGGEEAGNSENQTTDKTDASDNKDTEKKDDTKKDDESGNKVQEKESVEKKVADSVDTLKEQFSGNVKVVGSTVGIKKAVSATTKNGVFVDASGKKVKNSFVVDAKGDTYFTNDKGKAVKKTIVTDGNKMYYCGKTGAVVKNKAVTLADGSRMLASKSGALVTKSNSKVKVNGEYYLTTENGILASKQIVTAQNGKMYYAGKNGKAVINKTVKVDGVKYKAGKTGALKKVK